MLRGKAEQEAVVVEWQAEQEGIVLSSGTKHCLADRTRPANKAGIFNTNVSARGVNLTRNMPWLIFKSLASGMWKVDGKYSFLPSNSELFDL